MKEMTRKQALKFGAIIPLGLGVSQAFAADSDALAAITGIDAAGYGAPLYALAAAAVAVMVGVKWIKRARGAA